MVRACKSLKPHWMHVSCRSLQLQLGLQLNQSTYMYFFTATPCSYQEHNANDTDSTAHQNANSMHAPRFTFASSTASLSSLSMQAAEGWSVAAVAKAAQKAVLTPTPRPAGVRCVGLWWLCSGNDGDDSDPGAQFRPVIRTQSI